MALTLYSNRHLLAVRWRELVASDIDEVVERARAMHRREGRRLLYLGLQYDDTPLPSRAVTKHLIDRSADFFSICGSIYLVNCATGLSATLHRTALRSMMTMARIARLPDVDRSLVLDTIDAALAHAGSDLPGSIAEVRAGLISAGMP